MNPSIFRSFIRAIVYRVEKIYQRVRFRRLPVPELGWPVLLGISFPKSGTHLLDQILLGFSAFAPLSLRLHSFYAEYVGESGRKRSLQEMLLWLESLGHGDIASAHLYAHPEAVERVCTPAFVPYFIFRDPRDVAVSHVFYVTEMEPKHVHHEYYRSLPDINSRLMVSILGRPGAEVEFPGIASRFSPYLGWLDQPAVLKIHFEDLVNLRREVLGSILDHFLSRVPMTRPREFMLDALEGSINPERSPTFRSGKVGEWKKYFNDEHKQIFKDTSGDLLIQLGYETNRNW
ncbi:MAG: hypothetical protein A2Y54_09685 [Chloroflexi bacterium RBG_16_51_16]|nr:MAG: hypothetical protein A2Y54_09685 [Chloroflexi bacterium RBG_16_51_16]